MAAGVSCGTPIMPGKDVVRVMTIPMAKAPKSMSPIPPGRNRLRSPEKISAANEISMLMVTMAAINPAVRLGSSIFGWNSFLNSVRFIVAFSVGNLASIA